MSDTNMLFTLKNRLSFDPGGSTTTVSMKMTVNVIVVFLLQVCVLYDTSNCAIAGNVDSGLVNPLTRGNLAGGNGGGIHVGTGGQFSTSAAVTGHGTVYAIARQMSKSKTGDSLSSLGNNIDDAVVDVPQFLTKHQPQNMKQQHSRSPTESFQQIQGPRVAGPEINASSISPSRLSNLSGALRANDSYEDKSATSAANVRAFFLEFRNSNSDAVRSTYSGEDSPNKQLLFMINRNGMPEFIIKSFYKMMKSIHDIDDASTPSWYDFFPKHRPHVMFKDVGDEVLPLRHLFRRKAPQNPAADSAPSDSATTASAVKATTTGSPSKTASQGGSTSPILATQKQIDKLTPTTVGPKRTTTKGASTSAKTTTEKSAPAKNSPVKTTTAAKRHTENLGSSSPPSTVLKRSTSAFPNQTEEGDGSGCDSAQCYASRFPYHWTQDASWALGSIIFLLCVLTFFVLYTGLWKKRNPMGYPLDSSVPPNPNRNVNITELLKKRLAMIPKHLRPKRYKRRRMNGKKYEVIPLHRSNGKRSDEEGEDDFFCDDEEDLYLRDEHNV